jgi:hypothetical protein
MATSFVHHQGHGFWVSDGLLEMWLLAVVREIDQAPSAAAWLRHLRDEWYALATMGLMGCIDPELDAAITSAARRNALVAIMSAALPRVQGQGGRSLRPDLVVENWVGFGERNVPLQEFIDATSEEGRGNLLRLGRQFMKLLRGEVVTVASDRDAIMPWGDE